MPKQEITEIDSQLFPSFRPGVSYFRNSEDEIYVGFRHRGLALISHSPAIDRVLELLDGSLSIAEILNQVAAAQPGESVGNLEISKLLNPLLTFNFIELSSNRMRVKTSRELLSQSFINQEAKLRPELNLYSME